MLDCLGKLLEKVVTKRLRFGGQNCFGNSGSSSCLDPALTLHDVETAKINELQCGILIFDAKDFFDKVIHAQFNYLVKSLRFSQQHCDSTRSFLDSR